MYESSIPSLIENVKECIKSWFQITNLPPGYIDVMRLLDDMKGMQNTNEKQHGRHRDWGPSSKFIEDTPEEGVINLTYTPEDGYWLWYHGQCVWKSPKAKVEVWYWRWSALHSHGRTHGPFLDAGLAVADAKSKGAESFYLEMKREELWP